MSEHTPYVRPGLTATQRGIPDPASLVDLWLDRLLELAGQEEEPTPTTSYDLLALLGRLERCRPEWIAATGRDESFRRERVCLSAHLTVLARRALEIPDPDGWLREAADLAAACDDGADGDELADWAAELLEDLDDADLVAWAARQAGCASLELEHELARCAAWLAENPDRFFPAGVLVQGLGQTLRPDMVAEDADLARTADKLVILLDALEDAEAALSRLTRPRPAATATPREAQEPWGWLLEEGPVLAADVRKAGGLRRLRWRSPDGVYEAVLVINPADTAATHVRVNFVTDQGPAVELAGQTAWLGGCPALIDGEGNADFEKVALKTARAAGRPVVLAVGSRPAPWPVKSKG